MKQVLLGKGVFVTEVPSPGLGRGQVLVEVAYSFISTGTEAAGVKSAAGGVLSKIREHPQRVAQVLEMVRVNGVKRTLARVRGKLETRQPLGYSCAGRVLATSEDVQHLAPGDMVACAGMGYASHAEVVAVPKNLVVKLPQGCDVRQAAGTTVASIALHGVRRAEANLGETVAVVGLGLLGQIALQFLRASGVRVLGFDGNPKRVAEAQAAGFADCFALVGEEAVHEVQVRTEGRGADAVIITAATSAPGICQNAMEMSRRKGRVVVVGAVPLELERDPFYRQEIDFVISSSYGPGRYDPTYEERGQDYPLAYVRWTENRNMQAIVQMIADGTLRLDQLISAEYPIAQADQAFAALAAEGSERPLAIVLKYELTDAAAPAKRTSVVALPHPKPAQGKLALGIIGLGGFCTNTHLPNLRTLEDRYQIVATCDRNGAIAQDVARQVAAAQVFTDAQALIADPKIQVVLIATRHDTHAPLARAALQAGKHVFVEKPVAMNDAELAALSDTVAATGLFLMVGYNRRFSPHAVRMREAVRQRVSPVVVNYRVFADPAPPDNWIYTPAGGGRVIGEACHMFDLCNFLVGDGVAVEEMDTVAPPPGRAGPPGDTFITSLRYADGSLATVSYSVLGRKSKGNGKERVEALWDGKTYVIEDYVNSFGAGCRGVGNKPSKGHYEELVALADFLQGRGPCPLPWEATALAATQSYRVDAVCRGAGVCEEQPQP